MAHSQVSIRPKHSMRSNQPHSGSRSIDHNIQAPLTRTGHHQHISLISPSAQDINHHLQEQHSSLLLHRIHHHLLELPQEQQQQQEKEQQEKEKEKEKRHRRSQTVSSICSDFNSLIECYSPNLYSTPSTPSLQSSIGSPYIWRNPNPLSPNKPVSNSAPQLDCPRAHSKHVLLHPPPQTQPLPIMLQTRKERRPLTHLATHPCRRPSPLKLPPSSSVGLVIDPESWAHSDESEGESDRLKDRASDQDDDDDEVPLSQLRTKPSLGELPASPIKPDHHHHHQQQSSFSKVLKRYRSSRSLRSLSKKTSEGPMAMAAASQQPQQPVSPPSVPSSSASLLCHKTRIPSLPSPPRSLPS
ncbi:uncharacterized protein PGTG_00952 [Puccinia graminis f. sp. tritici CRL 75-36-700-3]|uniref:Uncharacterized protein n=1 Tax=Puccinia graminis f. sp. tritici (strain CRL 75-36-700-3 / race SCCL) TaxID=418459 RepID=E3JU96_PUCGT|nr:uncharacterized protein PGTG_00952 [Puccinia graminis f. sp. tritici CRL 75-36-700-3]EFP75621.2 hypothetical protein PGTG_00952 [Puccinia graminis f. sp. tritici CRL 75-36-700-3]